MEVPAKSNHFTATQHHLLNMFSKELPDEQIEDIRKLLAKYFADKLSEEMDKHIESSGQSVNDWVEEMKNAHLRTPYKT